MADKITPGEWKAECVGSGGTMDNPVDVYEITNGYTRIAEHVSAGDAYLLAAAKELFAALQEVNRILGDLPAAGNYGDAIMRARAAIAKAKP